MFFLLSGEGITDIGVGQTDALICEGEDFFVGPMTRIAAMIVEAMIDYSIIDVAGCGFVSEGNLAQEAKTLKTAKKLRLPGKKQAKETRYYFNTARMLACIANRVAEERDDEIVAILFRDADGTASAGRGEWHDKRKSMLDGFAEERFLQGVPMIPKPKSEAWLICAWKKHPYQACDALEDRSGNDDSPKNLKDELAEILDDDVTPDLLNKKVEESFNIEKINMPSFKAFRDRLEEVLTANSHDGADDQ